MASLMRAGTSRMWGAGALASALAVSLWAVQSAEAQPGRIARAAAVTRCGDPAKRPWCKRTLTADQRVALLLPKMTADEKISLLASDDPLGGPLGGFSENAHADTSAGVARLGIPPISMADGPAGVRQGKATALPAPITAAASFDPATARDYGTTVAWEARHRGNDLIFGPTVDVLRNPRDGRSFEGFGEDPFLSAATGTSWIGGAQAQGVLTSVKHLAVYTQETDRTALSMKVDPRTLREIYLPPFEAAVRNGNAATVMCGFGQLNGRWACQDGATLNTILRKEWGFKGFVASDHTAAQDTVGAANGGLDLELPYGYRYSNLALKLALAQKKVTQATVDAHVRAILRTMFAFGMFDRPAYANDLTKISRAGSETAAQRIEESGITLLKNAGGVLPLKAPKRIALIGGAADANPSGFGSAQVQPFTSVTPRQGIGGRAGAGATVTSTSGRDQGAAAKAARDADVAIVFATDSEGEFFDRSCLTLNCGDPTKGDQDGLISAVADANPNTVVVLETGGPVLTPWADKVKGVVEAWYPGARGGDALARVLYGDVDPGGRLPFTFPAAEGDAPTAGNPAQFPGVDKAVTFSEGVLVGYRHYDAKGIAPRYPFGFGLSYTRFRYSGLKVTPTSVRVTVTNTGSRKGVTVPQLYLGLPAPNVTTPQPPRQLKGFQKLTLAAGASSTVTFPITDRSVAYWDLPSHGWKVAPGCYRVQVGDSSRDVALTGAFARAGGVCRT
ncbi:beta-glucosidase family protein [Actinomadura harenae]|nr:glycoside hydrolase family 3 C-terminal domain-containing protein [Actinomadura harenae]